MAKKLIEVFVIQLTESGAYRYPWIKRERGEAIFTKSFDTCYFENKTFKKIKGGGTRGGNYRCIETGNEYRIST